MSETMNRARFETASRICTAYGVFRCTRNQDLEGLVAMVWCSRLMDVWVPGGAYGLRFHGLRLMGFGG